MKPPQRPPRFHDLLALFLKGRPEEIGKLWELSRRANLDAAYHHWDEIRRRTPPAGFSVEEWWLALKLRRGADVHALPLLDCQGIPFTFSIPEPVHRLLHEIDTNAGRTVGGGAALPPKEHQERYLVSSLTEEAITSSQLEGAVTTRQVAKELLRSGRTPRDKSERMILNNFRTMSIIRDIKTEPMSPELLMRIHRLVTDGTLENETAAGRFRGTGEQVQVRDEEDRILHEPPPATDLAVRCQVMCDFANGKTPESFVHPVVRSILLHFWLAYDHPFVDGNGRTARSLFYWSLARHGYWLAEYISISSLLVKAPAKYARAFLHTETDDNDLTYFILHQADVIRRSIEGLHDYIRRKQEQSRELQAVLKRMDGINHRQEALLSHVLRHPGVQYTIAGHQRSHQVTYATARADLLSLVEQNWMVQTKRGKTFVFEAAADVVRRLRGDKVEEA